MAKLADVLKGKHLEQAREMLVYAKANGFETIVYNQLTNQRPRIYIVIYPEGKPKAFWEKNDHAVWYFYTNKENYKDNFGSVSQPEVTRGYPKSYKNFKRFMSYTKKRYACRYNKKEKP
jgi:hypothetical protein